MACSDSGRGDARHYAYPEFTKPREARLSCSLEIAQPRRRPPSAPTQSALVVDHLQSVVTPGVPAPEDQVQRVGRRALGEALHEQTRVPLPRQGVGSS